MSQLAQLYIVALTLLLKNLCWLWISFGVKAKVLNKAWKVPELALGCFFSVWSILFQMSPWFTLAQWSSLGNYFSLSLFFYLTLFFSIMTTWYLFSWLHLLRCKLNRILYFSILAAWNKVCYMVGAQGLLGVEINDLPILTTTLRGSLGTFFFFWMWGFWVLSSAQRVYQIDSQSPCSFYSSPLPSSTWRRPLGSQGFSEYEMISSRHWLDMHPEFINTGQRTFIWLKWLDCSPPWQCGCMQHTHLEINPGSSLYPLARATFLLPLLF